MKESIENKFNVNKPKKSEKNDLPFSDTKEYYKKVHDKLQSAISEIREFQANRKKYPESENNLEKEN